MQIAQLQQRLAAAQDKANKLRDERDMLLQAIYNHLQYAQPIEHSARSAIMRHCAERKLEIPKQYGQSGMEPDHG